MPKTQQQTIFRDPLDNKKQKLSNSQNDFLSQEGNFIMWFRSDLRIKDNRALEKAFKRLSSNQALIALYVVCHKEWKNHYMSKFKADFIFRNLKSLQNTLKDLNIPLAIIEVDEPKEIHERVYEFCKKYNTCSIYFNKEYEVDERSRDEKLLQHKSDLEVIMTDDQCIIEPGKLLTNEDESNVDYGQFIAQWIKLIGEDVSFLDESNQPKKLDFKIQNIYPELFQYCNTDKVFDLGGFALDDEKAKLAKQLYPEGEEEAHRILEIYKDNKNEYRSGKHYPPKEGSSLPSMYLSAGVLSARHCYKAAKTKDNNQHNGQNGNELILRDFYRHILYFFPHVCKNKPFKKEAESIQWDDNEEFFTAWCEGRTGYPIVDAAMRQLNKIGWIHQKLRIIASMFFAKELLIDWRKGEKYFMQHLVDADFASNNGLWQWCNWS